MLTLHFSCIYKKRSSLVVVLIYVYVVIIIGNDVEKIQDIKNQLHKQFSTKYLGSLKYFLGIEVAKTSDVIFVSYQ